MTGSDEWMNVLGGWAVPKAGASSRTPKRFASQVATPVIGHQSLSARTIQAHKDQDPEKFQIQGPI